MPACKNDPQRTYTGGELSPKGLGLSAHAEPPWAVMTGRDGERWRNRGGTWVRVRKPKASAKAAGGGLPKAAGGGLPKAAGGGLPKAAVPLTLAALAKKAFRASEGGGVTSTEVEAYADLGGGVASRHGLVFSGAAVRAGGRGGPATWDGGFAARNDGGFAARNDGAFAGKVSLSAIARAGPDEWRHVLVDVERRGGGDPKLFLDGAPLYAE